MQVQINLKARFATPFSVGTGVLGGTTADKPLLKDAAGVPYLPGSALKGLLRHETEKIVRALWGDEAVCRSPNSATMCPQNRPQIQPFCPVCRIFGSPWRPSSLRFSDLKVEMSNREVAKKTDLRFGVSISRYRNATVEERLYTIEVASTAQALFFQGTIEGYLPNEEGLRLLALVLVALRAVEAAGGGKSRGLGSVKLEATTVEPVISDIKEVLEEWLTSPSMSQLP